MNKWLPFEREQQMLHQSTILHVNKKLYKNPRLYYEENNLFLQNIEDCFRREFYIFDSINHFFDLLIILSMHHKKNGSNLRIPQDTASTVVVNLEYIIQRCSVNRINPHVIY